LPDGGAINIAALVAIFEDAGYVQGGLAIGFGDGGADKL